MNTANFEAFIENIEVAKDAFPEIFQDDVGSDTGVGSGIDFELGYDVLKTIFDTTNLDVKGVIRRKNLIPFTLIPRTVANKHSRTQKTFMLENLQQANDAFIFGSPNGAITLMRSVMEPVLKEHYCSEGRDLNELINNASQQLPADVNLLNLHQLRMLANKVLHLDSKSENQLTKHDERSMEIKIISLLFVLRNLIEGAPD